MKSWLIYLPASAAKFGKRVRMPHKLSSKVQDIVKPVLAVLSYRLYGPILSRAVERVITPLIFPRAIERYCLQEYLPPDGCRYFVDVGGI